MTDYRATADALLGWARDRDYQGDDFYWKSTERYPMALGYFLRAACALSVRFPGDAFYTDVIDELTSSIVGRSNLSGRSRYHHWGLPFPWPTLDDTENALSGDFFWDPDNPLFSGPLPAHSGYGVTTAIVGHGLIDALDLNGDDGLREVIEQVGNRCVEDCGYRLIDGKVFFNYAPAMNHEIYNGSALVAAFLSRAAGLTGHDDWARLAASAMSLMSDVQDERGGWVYAKERQEIEYHYGYNLESLALYHRTTRDPSVLPTITLGVDYYLDHLIDPDGRCLRQRREARRDPVVGLRMGRVGSAPCGRRSRRRDLRVAGEDDRPIHDGQPVGRGRRCVSVQAGPRGVLHARRGPRRLRNRPARLLATVTRLTIG